MSSTDDSSIADARTLKLAKRKRACKRAMCEELVNELEKGLSLIKDSEEDDKTKMLAGLLGGKRSLLDLKKELVSLDDDCISLVSDDDEADSLSRDSAQLYRIIQAVVTEVEIVSASVGQNQQRDGLRMQPISVKLPKLEIKSFQEIQVIGEVFGIPSKQPSESIPT